MDMITKARLHAEDVRELTERLLQEQLSLEVEGYKITTSMVLSVLLKAAVESGIQCCASRVHSRTNAAAGLSDGH